ncbi:Quinone oxidoreductase PIG3 [Galdieria sulphuraria]|nr:Quinone oxidoreductase PIG3 [Galdieria sulphuraria]
MQPRKLHGLITTATPDSSEYDRKPENCLVVVEREVPDLSGAQLLVKVRATAINRADIMQRHGRYPPPPGETDILGLECAGEIVEVGPGCKRDWKRGDRVMALVGGGGYADLCVVEEACTIHIPENWTFEQAAAVPEAWLTASQLLMFVAQTKPGDWVLIHAGASGVGLAAVQIATKVVGAKAICTAGSQEKLNACIARGASEALNYKDADGAFSERVLQITEGHGVDVILDYARWVIYGTLGGTKVPSFDLRVLMSKRASMLASTLRNRDLSYKASLIKNLEQYIMPRFVSKECEPVIAKVFYSLESVPEAHRFVESNANIGKVVVSLTDETSSL